MVRDGLVRGVGRKLLCERKWEKWVYRIERETEREIEGGREREREREREIEKMATPKCERIFYSP